MRKLALLSLVLALLVGAGAAFPRGQSSGGAFIPSFDYPGIYNRARTVLCSFSTTCANQDTGMTGRVFGGIVTLTNGSATISGISPTFTSTSTGFCMATDLTAASGATVKALITGVSSIQLTGGILNDAVAYECIVY